MQVPHGGSELSSANSGLGVDSFCSCAFSLDLLLSHGLLRDPAGLLQRFIKPHGFERTGCGC